MKGTKKSGVQEPELVCEVISMSDVPAAPLSRTSTRYFPLYQKLRELGLGERNAVKVTCVDQKGFLAIRSSLRKMAERESKILCSSRTLDYQFGYFWLTKPEAPK